jgi:hypothetical protein
LYRSSDGTFAISMQTDVSRCWSAAIPWTNKNPSSLDPSADRKRKMQTVWKGQ